MALEQLDLFGLSSEPVKEKKKAVAVIKPKPEKPAVKKSTETKPKSKRGRKSNKEVFATVDLINIPDDETLNKKLYHSITEVAVWFNVNPSQLRFWEKEFSILKPRKNKKGDRLFTIEDIKNLKTIYYLLRNRKFSIEGAREYLKGNKHKTELHLQMNESLNKIKSFLLELKVNLESTN
jgi:DNA-binding transcriptional MerR regulator